jgi:hypothetical protein
VIAGDERTVVSRVKADSRATALGCILGPFSVVRCARL